MTKVAGGTMMSDMSQIYYLAWQQEIVGFVANYNIEIKLRNFHLHFK